MALQARFCMFLAVGAGSCGFEARGGFHGQFLWL